MKNYLLNQEQENIKNLFFICDFVSIFDQSVLFNTQECQIHYNIVLYYQSILFPYRKIINFVFL